MRNSFLLFFLSCMVIFSCQKEFHCPDCNVNLSPVPHAGNDQTVHLPKDSVMLDGSSSTDPDGNITSYKWTKIAGPVSSKIISPGSSKTMVKDLAAGVYSFELTVTDNDGLTAEDTVQVNVENPITNPVFNVAPVAHAGFDEKVTLPNNTAILTGTQSYDPDGTLASFKWVKISGPSSYSILDTTAALTTVKQLSKGVYVFELTVTDNGGLSAKDMVQIIVE